RTTASSWTARSDPRPAPPYVARSRPTRSHPPRRNASPCWVARDSDCLLPNERVLFQHSAGKQRSERTKPQAKPSSHLIPPVPRTDPSEFQVSANRSTAVGGPRLAQAERAGRGSAVEESLASFRLVVVVGRHVDGDTVRSRTCAGRAGRRRV